MRSRRWLESNPDCFLIAAAYSSSSCDGFNAMNAIVKKAVSKLSELPQPIQESVAKKLLASIEKWQALRSDVLAGFAGGPSEPWDKNEIKAEGRRRLAAKRKNKK
jgi:hypothetical protein